MNFYILLLCRNIIVWRACECLCSYMIQDWWDGGGCMDERVRKQFFSTKMSVFGQTFSDYSSESKISQIPGQRHTKNQNLLLFR